MADDRPLETVSLPVVIEVQEHFVAQHFKERGWTGVERRRAVRWTRHQSPTAQLAKKRWPHTQPWWSRGDRSS